MGKRVKKKGRALQKEKRVVVQSPKAVIKPKDASVVSVDNVDGAAPERRGCVHLDKGFDVKVFSEKIQSSDLSRCEDCREGVADRKGGKGKGKHGKKKGSGSVDSKSDTKAIWVCLQCGHLACGGVGLPTTPQSHAVRHSRLTRHPLVIQMENPHLRWCFPCNNLIPLQKAEENGDKKDALEDVVKLIKTRLSQKTSSADVEDVWFGSGSVASENKLGDSLSRGLVGGGSYIVQGLVNLGNTCFFNSVMQNLLGMDRLRDYFLNQDSSYGPVSMSLKKLFAETESETGLKGVINPNSLFGSLCSKAPQFRGYQQQDSHELLRYLLDSWSTEELAANKDGKSPTFVDSVFGGRISSSVSCLECDHSSTVYEPFVDLSLPVPTKKPTTRKIEPAARGKKTKLPAKKAARPRPQSSRDADSWPGQSISNCSGSSSQTVSNAPLVENTVASSSDTATLDSTHPIMAVGGSDLASQNYSSVPESKTEQIAETTINKTATVLDDLSWLDYVGPDATSDEQNFISENILVSEDSRSKDVILNDKPVEDGQISSIADHPDRKPNSSLVDPWEEEVPVSVPSSDVLLLSYKDGFSEEGVKRGEAEASSSFVGGSQEEVDFDGFGDLFNELEVSTTTVSGPSLSTENTEAGFITGNSSWSDLDEVDNTDAPVSVESCLAHFVKLELLSNDDAWECENCAKILMREQMEVKKKQTKTAPEALVKGGESDPQFSKEISDHTELKDLHNGDVKTDSHLNSVDQVLNNGTINEPNECSVNTGTNETRERELIATHVEQKNETGDGCDNSFTEERVVCQPTSTTKKADGDQYSQFDHCESEDKEDEAHHKNLKGLKVKRDASKRVLVEKAPPILTIHLKRFSQDARGRLTKLNGHVNFRDVIDLRPFMDPRCSDIEKHVYRLLGVVEHLGTMRGGHYVAYVRGKKNKRSEEKETEESVWYNASDAYVREVSLEEVLRCEAYILFYERV